LRTWWRSKQLTWLGSWGGECQFGDEWSAGDTHCQILTINLTLTLYHGTMDVRNDGVGVYNALMNVGDNQICVDRKFGLEEVS